MAKDKGWVKLHRKIYDNEIWKSREPFDIRSAWIDLILMANHEPKTVVYGKSIIKIGRGQLHTSINHLAKRWKWSPTKVRRALKLFSDIGMVQVNGTPNGTTLTLVKYGVYQDQRRTYDTTNDRADDTTNDTTGETQTRMKYKNEYNKNIKEVKKGSRQTDDDIDKLVEKMKREGKL